MARRTATPEPTPEAITETAEAQAAADQAMLDFLKDRTGPSAAVETPRAPTLSENFVDVANLIAESRKKLRLSEQTLVRVWELTLMWYFNSRESSTGSLYPQESGAEVEGESDDTSPLIPNEVIAAEPTATEE